MRVSPVRGRPALLRVPRWLRHHPLRALLVGVLSLMLLGAGVLLSAPMQRPGATLSVVDALLLATSAVCTTGLTGVNLAEVLSPAGQLWLTALVEVGALGVLLLAFGFAGLGRPGVAGRARASAQFGLGAGAEVAGLVRRVLALALGIQAAGFLVLLPDFLRLEGVGTGLRYALMHTVMSFGNAGFGLWPDGVARLWSSSLLVLMALVMLGGLGFVALDELERRWRGRRAGQRPPRLSTTTRVGLKVNLWLWGGGAAAFLVLEGWRAGTLGGRPLPEAALHAAFQTTVARSAGFATLDYGALSGATLLLVMALMFVGGNPGSTAGGIKTTTLAVLLAATRAALREHGDTELAGRRVPSSVLMRALTIVTLTLAAAGVGTLLLLLTNPALGALPLAFEAVSALTTSGLSVNVTPRLSDPGKAVLIALMVLGRVGFLGLLLAFRPARPQVVRRPEDPALVVG